MDILRPFRAEQEHFSAVDGSIGKRGSWLAINRAVSANQNVTINFEIKILRVVVRFASELKNSNGETN